MDWQAWIGKRIFVRLTTGDVYSGNVIDVDEKYFSIIDKFGERVCFSISKIDKIKEEAR